MSDQLSGDSLVAELKASSGFDGDAVLYASAPNAESLAATQQSIIGGVRDVIGRLGGRVTLSALLWASEQVYRYAVGKLPFPVPSEVVDAGWVQLKHAIETLYAELTNGS